jgi:glycolate oxidase iron-sulfur subunit
MKLFLPRPAPHPPSLEKYRSEISRCVRCGACRAVCPGFLAEREESLSARGRMALVEAVMNGRLQVSGIFQDRLAACTGCLACEGACPSGVPVTEVIQAAKEEAVRRSGYSIIARALSATLKNPAALRTLAWLAPLLLRYADGPFPPEETSVRASAADSPAPVRGSGPDAPGRKRGTVAFFPGCAISYYQPDIGRALIAVLDRLGFDVLVPRGQKCCGRPLLSLGDRAGAEECAAQNNALFSNLKVDAVVTACASCGLTFKKEYPKLLAPSGQRPVPVVDIHEFLADRIGAAALKPADMRITYHDPCHLGRGQGLSEAARKILRSIPGLALVEMKHADRCCGFGGVMRIGRRELSNSIGDAKAADIISTGASAVVTGCPGCRMQIIDALRRAGSGALVLHTVQVLEKALSQDRRCAMQAAGKQESCILDHAS